MNESLMRRNYHQGIKKKSKLNKRSKTASHKPVKNRRNLRRKYIEDTKNTLCSGKWSLFPMWISSQILSLCGLSISNKTSDICHILNFVSRTEKCDSNVGEKSTQSARSARSARSAGSAFFSLHSAWSVFWDDRIRRQSTEIVQLLSSAYNITERKSVWQF